MVVRRQKYQTKYEELTRSMVHMKQQASIIEDMMQSATVQMAEVRGSMQELEQIQNILKAKEPEQ